MSGPKRNPDKLNTIGVVVVGICGAVLVYVTIVALQAFYVNDTSEVQTMADYGGQDTDVKSLRTTQTGNITAYATSARPAAPKPNEAAKPQTYHIPIDVAMKLVVEGARIDPGALIPAVGPSDKSTVLPIFGRPKLIPPPAPAAPATPAAGSGADAAAPAGADAVAPAGAGSAAPAAPMVATPPAPKVATPPSPKAATPAPKAATPAPKAATPAPKAATPPAPKAGAPSAPKGNGK